MSITERKLKIIHYIQLSQCNFLTFRLCVNLVRNIVIKKGLLLFKNYIFCTLLILKIPKYKFVGRNIFALRFRIYHIILFINIYFPYINGRIRLPFACHIIKYQVFFNCKVLALIDFNTVPRVEECKIAKAQCSHPEIREQVLSNKYTNNKF